jgi:hypothetical protein
MLFRVTVSDYCEKHVKHTNTFCGENAEFHFLKAGGEYSDHWALKESRPNIILLEIICTNSVRTSQKLYYAFGT